MEDNFIHKLISKAKIPFSKKKNSSTSVMEYAFSMEEINDLNKENKKKILELKQDLFGTAEYKKKINRIEEEKKEEEIKPVIEEKLSVLDLENELSDHEIESHIVLEKEELVKEEKNKIEPQEIEKNLSKEKEQKKDSNIEQEEINSGHETSFISLSKENQQIVMEKWNSIDIVAIDRDILYGKDLLNHNYTITYPDDAARFIHKIRKEYEVVICYLIGFNNEKKGIYDKTIFSSKIDDEWHHLNQYIKILEKIRSSKK